MSTVSELIDTYPSINLNKYDEEDVELLHRWASEANDELWELSRRLENANSLLDKIRDIVEEQ